MRKVLIAAVLLVGGLVALLVFRTSQGDSGFGPPPALAAGKAPPLPEAGSFAEPRSLQQVGLPQALTASTIPGGSAAPEPIGLGKKLFFESRLSGDGTVSCASCHNPVRAFTDGRPTSIGIKGCVGQRNAPTVLNAMYNKTQFWDGRAATLELQAALPITNPCEMGSATVAAAASRIAGDRDYQRGFMSAYRHAPNAQDLVNAIAAYERTLMSFDSPFDHFIAGDSKAISLSAQRGWKSFNGKARCHLCHALTDTAPDPILFIDNDFHNIGIGIIKHNVVALAQRAQREIVSGQLQQVDTAAINSDLSVLGRFLLTKKPADTAAFKTPGLRNVMITAPYFHDGSQLTLWDVVDHYNKGDGLENPWLDTDMQPLALTEPEIDDLVAFMASLASPQYRALANKEFARQRAIANVSRPQRDTKRAFGPKPTQPPVPRL
ncbi:MAG: cytochrome c peroxidase [Sphingomonadales bacterium]|jgi:cytochrome c peroxidase|nr:cytochrome c peroxidase [Sphingomonadales bacterium]